MYLLQEHLIHMSTVKSERDTVREMGINFNSFIFFLMIIPIHSNFFCIVCCSCAVKSVNEIASEMPAAHRINVCVLCCVKVSVCSCSSG